MPRIPSIADGNIERRITRAGELQAKTLDLSVANDEDSPRLTEVPASLGALTQLQSLNLSGHRLTTLPREFGQLVNLKVLTLNSDNLTELPISIRHLTELEQLNVSDNSLTSLPPWLSELTRLKKLNLDDNRLVELPDSLGGLQNLISLSVMGNQLRALPESIGELSRLDHLWLEKNQLAELPSSFGALKNLSQLNIAQNKFSMLPETVRQCTKLMGVHCYANNISTLPNWIGTLKRLRALSIGATHFAGNPISDLPSTLLELKELERLTLGNCPLNPELNAAYTEGLDAIKRYLSFRLQEQIILNEAKLILIGEGEVGKSCLLAALRGDAWIEGNPTTHGIEIKSVNVTNPHSKQEITLNGWDFGGQRIYRPTHQLFFSAPAIYLVVWKPREGPQQGFVKEWITLVKHRAPGAKVLVVATHGGPKQRQPDIDRQEIWDLFGKEMVVDFFFVDSKPDKKTKRRKGIDQLKRTIARTAAGLPEVGRAVPKRWDDVRKALGKKATAYLPLEQVLKLCADNKMAEEEATDFVRISHRLGHLIHYDHDPLLQDIVVLRPDWLSIAISFVLDDEQTRKGHGLVSTKRLAQLWNDPKRSEDRYPSTLHPIFLRLMERYDLSYRVAEVPDGDGETSLVAQLVPDVRPAENELESVWPTIAKADEQQLQICRIVDARNGQSAPAEGLFYRLIVRLHKYSLGRMAYGESVHWQRGLVLDDSYNGRALLEYVGNDVRITVRAAYPERFLSVLTNEVRWLVEYFWKGLRCEVTVPCGAPCGKGAPGTGAFEVEKLITFKRQGMLQFPCYVSGCSQLQEIDALLRNAPTARRTSIEVILGERFDEMRSRLEAIREQLDGHDRQAHDRFVILNTNDQRVISQVEDAYTGLMQALTDEAKDGPRLFSYEPMDRRSFSRPKWMSAKFRLTLWCEHSRLPLPVLNDKKDTSGIYELDIPSDWVVKTIPYLKFMTGLVSLIVPVAASAIKLELDEGAYKGLEKQLDFGQKSLEAALKGGEKAEGWATEGDASDLENGDFVRAQGAILRQLHTWLREKDPSFGGLVRVQNGRQEFLWVHPKFAGEY